jgi:hypothetical protein
MIQYFAYRTKLFFQSEENYSRFLFSIFKSQHVEEQNSYLAHDLLTNEGYLKTNVNECSYKNVVQYNTVFMKEMNK